MKRNLIYTVAFVAGISTFLSCRKWAEIEVPVTKVQSEVVLSSNETAIALVNGIYAQFANSQPLTSATTGMAAVMGLSADEFAYWDPNRDDQFAKAYQNSILAATEGFSVWQEIYQPYIYLTNVAINRLTLAKTYDEAPVNTTLTKDVKKQLIGEAQFLRAFFYFYLVQLYGDVPLLTTDDYRYNAFAIRSPRELVYQQIIKDLMDAQENLNENYVESDAVTVKAIARRVKPNKWTAKALLARIYLYRKDYAKAEMLSSELIAKADTYKLRGSLDEVFLASGLAAGSVNTEAIWQLQPVVGGFNTSEARYLTLTSPPSSAFPIYLNPMILDAFESGDNRRISWVGSISVGGNIYYYPHKYKAIAAADPSEVTEYQMVMRLAEQYLICAEARAHLNNLTGLNSAETMVNAIRNRAGLGNTSATTQGQMLDAVMKERRAELFTEWGHRWLDLKRTGRIDEVMKVVAPIKSGKSWESFQQYYPIPLSDIKKVPGLTQTPGYF